MQGGDGSYPIISLRLFALNPPASIQSHAAADVSRNVQVLAVVNRRFGFSKLELSKLRIASAAGQHYCFAMSAAQILAELPKLTDEERAAIRRRLRELDERDEQQFLHDSADAMFRDMDQQEAERARRKTR
jgi:hypothetical protein